MKYCMSFYPALVCQLIQSNVQQSTARPSPDLDNYSRNYLLSLSLDIFLNYLHQKLGISVRN